METPQMDWAELSNLAVRSPVGQLSCPDCQLELTPYACGRTRVHKCVRCHGLWFEDKKISVFRDRLEQFDFSELRLEVTPPFESAYVLRSCALGHEVLEEVPYGGYNSRVHVFRCGKCRGSWLPLTQIVQLMDWFQLKQRIAPDIKAMLAEMGLVEVELRRYRSLRAFSRWLLTPISLLGSR